MSHHSTTCEQTSITQDNTVEIVDLDSQHIKFKSKPARNTLQHLNRLRSPRMRIILYYANALCMLALLIILYNLSPGLPPFITQQLSSTLSQSPDHPTTSSLSKEPGIACLTDTAQSPDKTTSAVLGSVKSCLQDDHAPGLINLYTTHPRKLLVQLHPDDAIRVALNSLPSNPPMHRTTISYIHITWSPDGKQLACTFIAIKHTLLYGVVLMDRDGKHNTVLLQQQRPSTPVYVRWDNQ